jgi:excisionase family DNA binding protein
MSPRPTTPSEVGRRWLSPKHAAEYLDLKAVGTIYSWVADGILPAVRIFHRNPKGVGRHRVTIRIDRLALDRWLEGRAR